MSEVKITSMKLPACMRAAVDVYRARIAAREGRMPSFGAIARQAIFDLLVSRDVIDPATLNMEEWNVRPYKREGPPS